MKTRLKTKIEKTKDKRIKKNEKWKMKNEKWKKMKEWRMKNEEETQLQESSHQQPVTGMPKNEPTDED